VTDEALPHPHLTVTRDGAVLTVSLDNADRRNAQTPSLWAALADVATGLHPAVRVVVLRGEGPSFSAGLDRGMLAPGGIPGEVDMIAMAAGSADAAAEVIEDFQRGFSAWAAVPAVVVAAVQGHAIGAGFQLALAADLRVVADDAQFAMRETSLGLVPDLAGTTPLVSLVGVARALEICATGRFVGASEAVAMGLANVAVSVDALEATTADLVAALLAAPEAALRELKPLLRSAASADRETQLRLEREAQGRLLHGLAGLLSR
jgi:enoyl-CoA hydratase/carnithine racemase